MQDSMMRVRGLILLVLIFTGLLAHAQEVASYPEILESHPFYNKQVTLPRDTALNGTAVDFGDYKDHIVLVHFWSLTCVGCYKEIPELNILAREFKDKKVLIISYMAESPSELNRKIIPNVKYYKLNKPVAGNDLIAFEIFPNASNIRALFASPDIPNSGVPITFILKNGILKDLSYGYMLEMGNVEPDASANYKRLKGMIEKYLQ